MLLARGWDSALGAATVRERAGGAFARCLTVAALLPALLEPRKVMEPLGPAVPAGSLDVLAASAGGRQSAPYWAQR